MSTVTELRMHLRRVNIFGGDHAAWPFRGEPISDRAVLTAVVLGIALS